MYQSVNLFLTNMSNFQTRKLSEFDKLTPLDGIDPVQGAVLLLLRNEFRTFLSTALKEQREEFMKCVPVYNSDEENLKMDIVTAPRKVLVGYLSKGNNLCRKQLLSNLKESGLLDNE